MINKEIIEVALSQYGVTENTSSKIHNEKILSYFHETGHKWVKDDETAWCSAFWNWVVSKCDLTGSGKLNARSWLDVGESIDIGNAKAGDTVVLWRSSPNSWKGHVGGYVTHDCKYVYILGGNQSNQVNIKPYLISRLLGVRRITK